MTAKRKVNERETKPSELGAGGVYRVVCSRDVMFSWEATLSGLEQKEDWLKLNFDNGVEIEGSGADIAACMKFYRRTW